MSELRQSIFNTLVVDEKQQLLKFGPTPDGDWVAIQNWGLNEWDVLVAIVSHPDGASARDMVRSRAGRAEVGKNVVHRVRRRLHNAMPRSYAAHAKALIVTHRGSGVYRLNSAVRVQTVPGRQTGAAEHGEHCARDFLLHAIKRTALELFGPVEFENAKTYLPEETLNETSNDLQLGHWIAVRHTRNWLDAIFKGPVRADFAKFQEFLGKMIYHRVTPYLGAYQEAARQHRLGNVQKMWRMLYNSGDLESIVSADGDWFEIHIRNHPYCEDELSRRVHGICWRFMAEVVLATKCELVTCELNKDGIYCIRISGDFKSQLLGQSKVA